MIASAIAGMAPDSTQRSASPLLARRKFIAACMAAVLLFAAAYSNSLKNGFHFDDVHVIESNLFIRNLANIPRFFVDGNTFSSLPQNATYRPLASVSFALDYRLAGLNPVAYHTTQLVLFLLIGIMLILLYDAVIGTTENARASCWTALFAGTLFCVHTGNTMAANYITARSELLAMIGVLGAFVMYIRMPRARRYYLYLVPVALGALAKSPAAVFAPLLLAYKLLIEEQLSLSDVTRERHRATVLRVLKSTAPAFVLGIGLVLFTEAMNGRGQAYGGGGRLEYLSTQAWIWVRYVRVYIVPTGLSADTDLKLFNHPDLRTLAGALLLAGSLAAAWFASKSRSGRPVAFGIVWFWIALTPTSTILPLSEVTNDYRAFFPYAGLNLAAVWFAWLGIRRIREATSIDIRRWVEAGAKSAGVFLVVGHAAATCERNKVWRTDETLWADVAKKSPQNGRGLMNYGLTLMHRGQLDKANELFLRAQQIVPNYAVLEINLGIVNNALGHLDAADQHFRRAVQLDPGMPAVHYHYARWLSEHGRGPEAVNHLVTSVALSPGDMESRYLLMALYSARASDDALQQIVAGTFALAGNDSVALAYAKGSVPLTPAREDARGWFALGWALTGSEHHVEAAQAYRRAAALDASDASAWNNLGWSLEKIGFFDAAVSPLERAVKLQPTYELASNNLAWARAELARRQPK